MPNYQRHLDVGSRVVILITIALFVGGLFLKGLAHDLVLETGVLLVSAKLIMLVYKNSVTARHLDDRLDDLQTTLTRIEGLIAGGRSSELGATPGSDQPDAGGPSDGSGATA